MQNEFLRSLDSLTPDDIAPPSPSRKKSVGKGDIAAYLLLVVFSSVFVFCAVQLVLYFREDAVAKDKYKSDEVANMDQALQNGDNSGNNSWQRPTEPEGTTAQSGVTIPPSTGTSEPSGTAEPDATTAPDTEATETTEPPVTEPDDGYSDKYRELRAMLDTLVAINPDIYGYLSIPVLDIGYPLLHSPDAENAYYLTHTYDKDENRAGSIFSDSRCVPKLTSNLNTVIYGHNMRNKTMFGKLQNLLSEKTLFDSAEIVIVTYEGIFTYELFSAYRTTSSYNYCRVYFPSTEELVDFCYTAQSKSSFSKDMTFYESDRIITLSTCTNLTVNGRYAFHAILVKIET